MTVVHLDDTGRVPTCSQDLLACLTGGTDRREPDPNDGRGVIVRYTDRGLEGLALARRHLEAMEADFAARIGVDGWAEVRTALRLSSPTARPTRGPRRNVSSEIAIGHGTEQFHVVPGRDPVQNGGCSGSRRIDSRQLFE